MGETRIEFIIIGFLLLRHSKTKYLKVMGNKFSADFTPDHIWNGPKRRKIDKNHILYNQRMFYVSRGLHRERGSYFESSHTKLVCNPNDFHGFYLMVGGIVYLPVSTRLDKFAKRIKECDAFGSYVYIEGNDRNLRTLLYIRKKGFPLQKSVSCQGTVNSVIPRYDGISGQIVIGMIIVNSTSDSDRRWTRYDDPQHSHENKGFFEMTELSLISRLLDFVGEKDDLFVIYVTKKTSLLMVDGTQTHLINDKIHHNVYTLFQEGAVLAFNCKLYFQFCDSEEDQEFDSESLYREKKAFLEGTPNLWKLKRFKNEKSGVRRVLFLTSSPNEAFWTLKVSRMGNGFPLECHLYIPSGGQFSDICEWEKGLRAVNTRQNQRPWTRYIEPVLLGGKCRLPNIVAKQSYPTNSDSDSDSDSSDDSDDQITQTFFGPYV